ncbi:MAG TPA: hypothetical protein VFS20_16970 [Longimicrobium sp.]|nr:hypothetical protein [Longimicrobium sp.]
MRPAISTADLSDLPYTELPAMRELHHTDAADRAERAKPRKPFIRPAVQDLGRLDVVTLTTIIIEP